jgi:hypothetical protein
MDVMDRLAVLTQVDIDRIYGGLTIGAAVITSVALVVGIVTAIEECNKPKKPQQAPPAPPPAPMRPSETLVYGRRRNLIEAQRQWMAAESQPFEALRVQDDKKIASEAFESWFDQFIEIQGAHGTGSVIPYDVWVLHYATYCDGHGYPKLGDQELFNALASYARVNHCGITENGELVGGQLKL